MSENLNKNEVQQEVTPQETVKETKSVELKLSIPKPDKNMIDKIKKGAMGVGAAGLLMLGGMHFGKGSEGKVNDFDAQIKKVEAEKVAFEAKKDPAAGEEQSKSYEIQEAKFDKELEKLRKDKDAVFADKIVDSEKKEFEGLGRKEKLEKITSIAQEYTNVLNTTKEMSVDEKYSFKEYGSVVNLHADLPLIMAARTAYQELSKYKLDNLTKAEVDSITKLLDISYTYRDEIKSMDDLTHRLDINIYSLVQESFLDNLKLKNLNGNSLPGLEQLRPLVGNNEEGKAAYKEFLKNKKSIEPFGDAK